MLLSGAYSPEAAAELSRLLDALPPAVKRASSLLQRSSIYDSEYLAADAEVAKLLTRINELMQIAYSSQHAGQSAEEQSRKPD
jgi:hypothetical protein